MKIIQYSDFGGPEVLELVESEKPLPATVSLDRGMNVTVHAVGLNPVDYKTFNGSLRFLEKLQRIINPKKWFQRRSSTFPRGVARDFAGVDDAGNAVLGTLYQPVTNIMRQGALATEILIAPEDMTLKPEGISFETAAALGVPGQTACGAFRALDLRAGDVIVISAAAGGVGSLATQLAVHRGATVIGIASGANADYVRSLGAIPVAYGEGLVDRVRAAAPTPVTKLLDCYGSEYITLGFSLGLSRKAIGTLVPGPKAALRGVHITGMRHAHPASDLAEIASLVADGTITIDIAHEYPFDIDSVRAAYTQLMGGHVRGKLVVKLQ